MTLLTPKTTVTVTQTRKVNLGNFESADIQIGVTYESFTRDEEQELYAKAADFVEEKIKAEVLELQKQSVNPVTQKKAEQQLSTKPITVNIPKEEKPADAEAPKKTKRPPAVIPDTAEESEDETPPFVKNAKAKPAKVKEEPVEEESEEASETVTLAQVKEELRKYAAATTKADAIKLMKKTTGKDKSDDVEEKDYAKLLFALKDAQDDM